MHLYQKYKTLTLLSSEECNLNCKYCHIAQSRLAKNNKKNENEKVKEAFINGQYLSNILKTCEELLVDKSTINTIELWGQEPTLTLSEFSLMLSELLKNFYNVNNLFFSTNGVDYIDKIIKFVQYLDSIINNKEFVFNIQFSYDGEYSTKHFRGIDPVKIKKNIQTFIEQLNLIELKNIKIVVSIHGVLSQNLLTYFDGDTFKINEFWKEVIDFNEYIKKLNLNKKVTIGTFYLGIENPIEASVLDGQRMYQFGLISQNNIEYKEHFAIEVFFSQNERGFNELNRAIFYKKNNEKNLNILIQKLINETIFNTNDNKILSQEFSKMYCGAFTSALKIRYDGTLVHCQDVLHQLTDDTLVKKSARDYIGNYMYKNNFYPNIIKNNIEPLKKGRYLVAVGKTSAFSQMFTTTLNLMILLAKNKQINTEYLKDNNKLLRHAFYFTFICTCMNHEMQLTGTTIGRRTGHIRLFCNGFMDLLEQRYLNGRKNIYEFSTGR